MIRRVARMLMLLALGAGVAARAARATDTGGAPAMALPSGAGGASGMTTDAAAAKRIAVLRHKVLRDEDFVENEETNRDPFHSYLRLFTDPHPSTKSRKLPSAFEKVGLEDLALIAIISGDAAPRAMFRDPSGYGQTVKKGDFISRSGARVTKILSDRVIVEITETTSTGEPRVVEKAILVNPDEAP